jgi:hypothetical protein
MIPTSCPGAHPSRAVSSTPHVLDRPNSSPAQGGGLVKMPDTVAQVESQAMGSGFTVYYMVDSIEEVRGSSLVDFC